MSQRSSAAARAFAAIAVVCGFVVLVVVISSSLNDGDGDGKRPRGGELSRKAGPGGKKVRAAYVVQNGDTLTSIARRTGVSVSRIEALNPGVDPQILVSGEKLKLR
jgi:hypothetical protein